MTAVALRPAAPVGSALTTPLGRIVDEYRDALTLFLRDGVTLERVAAELHLAARTTPGLDQCPAPALVDAICRALETGGVIGRDVYIVPFGKQPTVMVDYKFLVELVILAGGARSIDQRPVWSDEEFEVTYGSTPSITHRPRKGVGATDRRLMGAYAIAFLGPRTPPKIQWLPIDEIEAARCSSKQWNRQKVAECPPWYACKTATRRLVKLLPKNPKLARLLAFMEREEQEERDDPEEPTPDEQPRPAHVTADGEDLSESFPAPDSDAPQPQDHDEAWALAYECPFGELKGRTLGSIASSNYLAAIQEWAMRQQEKPNGLATAADLEHAATIVLDIRDRQHAQAVDA